MFIVDEETIKSLQKGSVVKYTPTGKTYTLDYFNKVKGWWVTKDGKKLTLGNEDCDNDEWQIVSI